MWRGALAYLPGLCYYGVRPCHMEAKRDEKTLEITAPMPLCKKDEELFKSGEYDITVPDPMFASGSSNSFAIDMLNGLGVPNEKITLLCVVAAPEGIFRISKIYPGVKIIAVALDDHLNEDAYIIPGLGDAGEKYFYENSIENFLSAWHTFNNKQWKHLNYLLEIANKK